MRKSILDSTQRLHFIGIGGIGVSAIARMMVLKGKKVSGSDLTGSPVTDSLKKLGVKIYLNQKAKNLSSKTDLVIYSIAVASDNPELKKARKLKIKTLTYPKVLGLISKSHFTIAISGTHGKTTTTAMVADILQRAGLDPTAVIGSLTKANQSNFIAGKSKYLVAEACEYKKSFLTLSPNILVITNIDDDHLDYYKSFKNIQRAFKKLAQKIPPDGYLVCNPKSPSLRPVVKAVGCQVIDYKKTKINFALKIPGDYNVDNARVAMAVASVLGITKSATKKSLSNFSGVWRRQEYKGRTKSGAVIWDDYAHHPTEIKALLKSLRETRSKKRIVVVFQPHLYSRTKLLLNDFAKSFGQADEVIITAIYAAREKPDKSISGKDLAERIARSKKKVRYVPQFKKVEGLLKKELGRGDLVVTVGAGDVYKIGESLI